MASPPSSVSVFSIEKPPDLGLTSRESIDFVIPDDSEETSKEALTQFKTLTHCSSPDVCPSSSPDRTIPPPAFHVHIKSSEVTVGIYLQSETLWFLPPIRESFSSPELQKLPSHFVFASDQRCLPPWRPGRGSGLFKQSQDPVVVVVSKSHILLEAFLRLYARDSGKRIGAFAMAMIAYMELYVDDDGLLDAKQLPEPLRKFYGELREGKKPVRQWKKELKVALGVPVEDSEDDSC